MEKKKSGYKRMLKFSVLNKLMLSYVVLISILASVIGITSFSLSASNYNRQVSNQNQKLLENYATYIDNTIVESVRDIHKGLCLNLNTSIDIEILFRRNSDMGRLRTLYIELSSIVAE